MVAGALLLVSLAFVVYVEGPFNPFWVWNAIPIGAASAWLVFARRQGARRLPAAAFGVGAVGVTVYVHLAWLFDWDRIATGSSTAGFIFLFLPVMAVICGVACWAVARLVLSMRRQAERRPEVM